MLGSMNKLSKYIKKIFFIHFKHFLYAKMRGKCNFSKSRYVASGVDILITAYLIRKDQEYLDSV